MKNIYNSLLGNEQTVQLISFFQKIENGVYNKNETLSVKLTNLIHPIKLRCIRADMQSFINTFIDPYLELKPYFENINFVIDAGANIGYTACLYANWWPNAQIISLEADKENYDLAVENLKYYPNVQVKHAALWSTNSKLKIEAGQEDGFVVKEIDNNTFLNENITIGVDIDTILKENNCSKIDFLKMNIEGSEKALFTKNYENWLPNTTNMLIELHDGKEAGCAKTVFNTINKYDFAVAETANYGILFCKEKIYRTWYAKWYKETIYIPNINKNRFPEFYLD
ncbi:MAG: FkbM family methyltransferase [Bacteroidetes bacterium]|nr:FkbM family methyltransferase [Bacteroidota bacterium]